MFYVKTKVNGETTITTEITDENVFTRCPKCGKEFDVHLSGVLTNGGDLCGTTVYCAECSAKKVKNESLI